MILFQILSELKIKMFLCYLTLVTSAVDDTYSYRGDTESKPYEPGQYLITCYGAQGGRAYDDGSLNAVGGKGAKVSGQLHLSSKTTLQFQVGGQGSSSKSGAATGGYPNGGTSEEEDQVLF